MAYTPLAEAESFDPEKEKELYASLYPTAGVAVNPETGNAVNPEQQGLLEQSREAEEAGYDHGTLSHMANGGYQKQTRSKRGYIIRKKHKDIVKAEYIINDQEE